MGMTIHLIAMIILFVVAITFLISSLFDEDEQYKNYVIGLISLILCIMLLILSCAGLSHLEKQEWKVSESPYKTNKIISLNDGKQTNGRFYLRHGYIEENMYYQYMMQKSDGGYSYGKVREDVATIYVTDNNFRVEWYTKERNWLWFEEEKTFCKIYVPEGCIKEEYNIDLE